jgi:hypothetical protein
VPGDRRRAKTWAWVGGLMILIVGGVSAFVAALTISDPQLSVPGGWSAVALVPRTAAAVNRSTPTGPIALYVNGPNSDFDYGLAYGVIWQLRQDGRDVTASIPHWQPLGTAARPAADASRLELSIRHNRPYIIAHR